MDFLERFIKRQEDQRQTDRDFEDAWRRKDQAHVEKLECDRDVRQQEQRKQDKADGQTLRESERKWESQTRVWVALFTAGLTLVISMIVATFTVYMTNLSNFNKHHADPALPVQQAPAVPVDKSK